VSTPVPNQSVINPRSPIVGDDGAPKFQFLKTLQDWQTRINAGLGQLGELIGTFNGLIAASAKIEGRTEGIGTTVSNIDVAGSRQGQRRRPLPSLCE
jgi:hypothetical protein